MYRQFMVSVLRKRYYDIEKVYCKAMWLVPELADLKYP